MEAWKKAWREGLAPLLEDCQLAELRKGLANDDEHMVQEATTVPPPLQSVQDWPVERACLIGYCFAMCNGGFAYDYGTAKINDKATTVGEVEAYFARTCYKMDSQLGEPAGCRWLLNYFDESPREEVFKALLEEVDLEIANRMETHRGG
jgi:hypothetical protein